ncbi:unnamed protein product, partial [Mesorhabditis belari]|uniref:Uncharacterized protein n=1 Tax=Mesorhabditis belari TaxID=2138241 RepID=A0AAF3FD20_9BILA
MGRSAPRAAAGGNGIPRPMPSTNPIAKEKDRIARMKEAKAKYSQMSKDYSTARVASSAPLPSTRPTTCAPNAVNRPTTSRIATVARKTSVVSFRGSATNLSNMEFVPCADSLDAIRNNRPMQQISGRASGFGYGRTSIVSRQSLAPRPSMLPFGINPFSEKCTADDKKIFNDYMKERLGPTSPMVPNSAGRPNLQASRVRFLSEDVIRECRESGGLVEENRKAPSPVKEVKNEVRSILKARLDTSKLNQPHMIIEEKENEPEAAIEKLSSPKKLGETPMLRRSKRPSLLFNDLDAQPSGSKSPAVKKQSSMLSPIRPIASNDCEEPVSPTPLTTTTFASTFKGWIDFLQTWRAASDEEREMFPDAMFNELCTLFDAERDRRQARNDNGLRRSKRLPAEKKKYTIE